MRLPKMYGVPGDRDGAGIKGGTLANMTGRPAEILKELSPEASFAILRDPLCGITGKCDAGVERHVGRAAAHRQHGLYEGVQTT